MSRKKTDYYDLMRKPTERYVDAQLQERYKRYKEKSELKKPYLKKSFPEMEYNLYDWPNIIPYVPDSEPFDTTKEIPYNVTDPYKPYAPDKVFNPPTHTTVKYPMRDIDIDFPMPHTNCPPNLECHPRNEQEVEQGESVLIYIGGMCGNIIEWELLPVSGTGFSLGVTGDNFDCPFCRSIAFVELIASADAEGTAYIRALDVEYAHHPRSTVICLVKAECNCDTTTDVAYDTINSDETIDREGEATVIVTDGCPPFSWAVAGTGFSFNNTKTKERTNILSADNTACGTATITVTDECGDECVGYVRCTTGGWVTVAVCYLNWTGGTTTCQNMDADLVEVIKENKKYIYASSEEGVSIPDQCYAPELPCTGEYTDAGGYQCDGAKGTGCRDCDPGFCEDCDCEKFKKRYWIQEWTC